MNKFLSELVVIAVCLALTHATSLTNRRLQALERGAAFLEAQSFGMFNQDPKKDKEEKEELKKCYKECRKTKKQCEKSCPKKAKDCRKECKCNYKECKEDCKGGGSGVMEYL
ncbi:uncharacterized protein LOC116301505 [Actinia tenebrosa]|uniref:Uncharacterized protein LOC116301505 n=1 Tax=Actinia tenebrosa TaxID=6105 RepID=A0A6P8II81_ACTTE|nr:uncharacterized protein LOC116301505 [Actinia tenebrosa]